MKFENIYLWKLTNIKIRERVCRTNASIHLRLVKKVICHREVSIEQIGFSKGTLFLECVFICL